MKEFWQAVRGYIRRLDKILLLMMMAAVAFSMTMLYSLYRAGFLEERRLKMQLLAGSLGFAAMLVMTLVSYRFLAKVWFSHLPVTLGLVLLTFTNLSIVYQPPGSILRKSGLWVCIGRIRCFAPSGFVFVRKSVLYRRTKALFCALSD